jgi:hypothetical protein
MQGKAWRRTAGTAALLMALSLAGCESTDVVAPDGSTITMAANPAVIVLSGGVQISPVDVTATVYNSIGVPLPGQDVRFSTSFGQLTPEAQTPVPTDDDGNATVVLTNATQAPTITARSGKASAMLTLQTATCNLSDITLNPSPLNLENCTDAFDLTAEATDTDGAPCVSILIQFAFVPTSTPTTDVSGTFNPGSARTDSAGQVATTLTLSSNSCNSLCVGATCTGQIRASSGSTQSNLVQIIDNVP